MTQPDRQLKFVEKIASSKFGAWYFVNVSSKIDPLILKMTDGRFSSVIGSPVLLLQHRGAKSNKQRETPLVYATDGDDIVLIASYGGSENNPAWYYNLMANPNCHIIAKDRTGDYAATELSGEDYDRMWTKAVDVYGGYEVYQKRSGGRKIPLLRLVKTS